MTDLEIQLEKLELTPGDLVVVRVPHDTDYEQVWHLHRALRQVVPGPHKVIVLQADITIESLSDERLRTLGLQRIP